MDVQCLPCAWHIAGAQENVSGRGDGGRAAGHISGFGGGGGVVMLRVVVIISALAKAPMGSHPQALTAFPKP